MIWSDCEYSMLLAIWRVAVSTWLTQQAVIVLVGNQFQFFPVFFGGSIQSQSSPALQFLSQVQCRLQETVTSAAAGGHWKETQEIVCS